MDDKGFLLGKGAGTFRITGENGDLLHTVSSFMMLESFYHVFSYSKKKLYSTVKRKKTI